MNLENEQAANSIKQLEQQFPNYPMLSFIQATPLWALAESTSNKKLQYQRWQITLDTLLSGIKSTKQQIAKYPENSYWKLNLGLSQSFIGLIYMRQGEHLDAYHSARAGRDTLRSLIHTNPDIEDAYHALGFYEIYTSSVPFYLSWLTSLIDLSGDRKLGLQYIHRSIDRAPIFSPEAARLLLMATNLKDSNSCNRLPLARSMSRIYSDNPFLKRVHDRLQQLCQKQLIPSGSHKVIREPKTTLKPFTTSFNNINYWCSEKYVNL